MLSTIITISKDKEDRTPERNKPKWKQTTLRLYFVQSKQFKSMEMESAGPSTELKQNEKDEDGTNIVEIRRFTCDLCIKEFKRKRVLLKHIICTYILSLVVRQSDLERRRKERMRRTPTISNEASSINKNHGTVNIHELVSHHEVLDGFNAIAVIKTCSALAMV